MSDSKVPALASAEKTPDGDIHITVRREAVIAAARRVPVDRDFVLSPEAARVLCVEKRPARTLREIEPGAPITRALGDMILSLSVTPKDSPFTIMCGDTPLHTSTGTIDFPLVLSSIIYTRISIVAADPDDPISTILAELVYLPETALKTIEISGCNVYTWCHIDNLHIGHHCGSECRVFDDKSPAGTGTKPAQARIADTKQKKRTIPVGE